MTLNLTSLRADESPTHHRSILITGGLWFIWSHVATIFAQQGYRIHIVDNLSNATIDVLTRLEKITNKTIRFAPIDITDESALRWLFDERWW